MATVDLARAQFDSRRAQRRYHASNPSSSLSGPNTGVLPSPQYSHPSRSPYNSTAIEDDEEPASASSYFLPPSSSSAASPYSSSPFPPVPSPSGSSSYLRSPSGSASTAVVPQLPPPPPPPPPIPSRHRSTSDSASAFGAPSEASSSRSKTSSSSRRSGAVGADGQPSAKKPSKWAAVGLGGRKDSSSGIVTPSTVSALKKGVWGR